MERNFIETWKNSSLYKKLNKDYKLLIIHRISVSKDSFTFCNEEFIILIKDGSTAQTSNKTMNIVNKMR